MAPPASIVQYDVASNRNSTACSDAIQTSYARFASTGFRRDKCVSPGSRLIASHRTTKRMVYANKNGLIRVLDPTGAQHNTIIDHHKADTVHDITYYPISGFEDSVIHSSSAPVAHVWASVATKKVVLWQDVAILVEMQMPPNIEPTKLVWNYTNTNLFWILCSSGVAIFLDVHHDLPGQSKHPVHQYALSILPDQLRGLTMIQDGAIDLCWSPFGPLHNTVASIHENGNLCLWDCPGGGKDLKQLRQVKTAANEHRLTRCAVVGPDTILVASDDNRTLALYRGQDLAHIGTLQLVGTKDSFVLETLYPDQATCRIVLTSRDQGLALIIGLNLTTASPQPFASINPFHSTMAGYSFHCTVVSAIEMDMEDPNVRNVKLTLYGPKEIQTWILQETQTGAIQPKPVASAATPSSSIVDGMTFDFADYTIEEDDDDEVVERDETATKGLANNNNTTGPPGLEKTTVGKSNNNPFVNWLGAISSPRPAAVVNETPPSSMPKFAATTPVAAQKLSPTPPPQPSFAYNTPPPPPPSMATPPPARQQQTLPTSGIASVRQGGTTPPPASRNVLSPAAVAAPGPPSTPAVAPPTGANTSSAVVPPTAAASSVDTKALQESVRSIMKEELTKHSSEISAQIARTLLIPAMESITQQILQKVSDHVDHQQTQNSLQLKGMSEQLTKVTSLISVLTKEVQSLQAQQQQQQQQHQQGTTTAPMDEAAILEQNAAKARHQVEYLLSQNDIAGALRHALAGPKTDLVYYCCEAADLTALLDAQPKLLSYQDLVHLLHRLSVHLTGNADSVQVDAILLWLQGICMATEDSIVDDQTQSIAPANVRTVIEHALAACSQAQTNNRRSMQMTIHLLRSLIR